MELIKILAAWIEKNPGKAVGAFIGFFVGILFLTAGVLGTVLIILLIFLGLLIGKINDDNVQLLREFKNFFKKK